MRRQKNKWLKPVLIIIVILVVSAGILFLSGIFDFSNNTGTMIGNPNYQDNLYIEKNTFLESFKKEANDYNFNQYEIENKREFILEFNEDMVMRVGLQSNESTLSYIIFSWNKEKQNNEAISIVSALYRIFDSDITEETIGDCLIELGLSEDEIDYETYEPFMPDNPVSFDSEEKEGIIKLYINDEAMGY